MIATVLHVIAGRHVLCELDPSIPFFARGLEGPVSGDELEFSHFTKEGKPVCVDPRLARAYERALLGAFQAAARGRAR
jgi:hypothetical protein